MSEHESGPVGHGLPASEGVGQRPPVSVIDGQRQTQARSEHHTLSVKEVARVFEEADVARTERSITRWCQPNPQGQSKLDCYFDTNEIKWLITPQSVTLAIAEEQARKGEGALHASAPAGQRRTPLETGTPPAAENTESTTKVAELEKHVEDLKSDKKSRDTLISSLQDALNRQSENFGKQIADVAERAGEYKADLRTTRHELQTAHQKLLQLNPGSVAVEAEEEEEPGSVSHTEPAPAVVRVQSGETSAAPVEEGRGQN